MSHADLFKADYEIGKANELKLLPKLKKLLKDETIQLSPQQHSIYDYYGDNKRIELKTRFNFKWTYKTTMIPLIKVKDAIKFKGDYYFCFWFNDRQCYIKYDKKLFATFEQRMGGRNDRNKDEYGMYVYIPVNLLKDF
jgi:hypothetical protein